MTQKRIPRADADFAAYADAYYDAVKAFFETHGLDPSMVERVDAARATFDAAYAAHIAAQNAAEAARAAKQEAKEALEAAIRPVTAYVQSNPATTNADRAAMGITIKQPPRRHVPAPTSRPMAQVNAADRLTHRVRIFDESAIPGDASTTPRGARPKGTLGAEVYVALVEQHQTAPADARAYRFLRTVTGGSAEFGFEQQEAGKQAAYLVRWVSSTGTPGPWSSTVTATIAA